MDYSPISNDFETKSTLSKKVKKNNFRKKLIILVNFIVNLSIEKRKSRIEINHR